MTCWLLSVKKRDSTQNGRARCSSGKFVCVKKEKNFSNSAAATAAVKSAGEARSPGIAQHGPKKEPSSQSRRTRLLEELRGQWKRQFGYMVEFFERIVDALN